MMRKNNNSNNRNNNMKHRNNNGGGQRRFHNNGNGGNNSSRGNDSGNIVRQKNHATQQLGKYSDMARNAQINGDRVDVEYFLQHVDHYTRVLSDIAAIEAERFAHHREQQASHAQHDAPHASEEGHTHSGDENAAASVQSHDPDVQAINIVALDNGPAVEAPEVQPQQAAAPRTPRPRGRRPYQGNDNGAAEANSNTTEIPLPGSILPPI